MYRIEIIANKSVQEDIEEALEENIPEILYTIIPLVYGKGEEDKKLGTTTWPETNFLMISYIHDSKLETAKNVVSAVKHKFSGEGIKMFVLKAKE